MRAAPSEMWSPTRCSVLVRWGAYYLYHSWCVAAQDAKPADPATNCNTWVVVLTTGSESGRVHYPGGVQVIYTYEDGLRWSIQIASALANLHAQRPLIIHRDLKLDNVLLTGNLTSHSCAQSWSSTAAGRPAFCRAWCTIVLRLAAQQATAQRTMQKSRTLGCMRQWSKPTGPTPSSSCEHLFACCVFASHNNGALLLHPHGLLCDELRLALGVL